jgi:hypothetical protein
MAENTGCFDQTNSRWTGWGYLVFNRESRNSSPFHNVEGGRIWHFSTLFSTKANCGQLRKLNLIRLIKSM